MSTMLFWRGIGGIIPTLNIELIIAKALALRGINVCVILCDGILSGCMLRTVLDRQTISQWPNRCSQCYRSGIKVIKAMGLPYRCMSECIDSEKVAEFRVLADKTEIADISSAYHHNLPVGEYALSSTGRYFKGIIPKNEDYNRVLREYYYSSLISSESAKRIIEDIKKRLKEIENAEIKKKGKIKQRKNEQ